MKSLILPAAVAASWIGLFAAVSPSLPAPPEEPTTLRTIYGAKPSTSVSRAKTALVLVDFQEELLEGDVVRVTGGDAAVANAKRLLEWARRERVTVVHVRNVTTRADSKLFAPGSRRIRFVPSLEPKTGEAIVTKSLAGGFSRSDLDAVLHARGIDTIVVAGVMTHLAVDTTARDGTVLGYRVIVAADACATRALPSATGGAPIDAATVHRVALASLADRFAEVLDVGAIARLRVD